MRYYKIVVTDPSSGNVIAPPGFSSSLLGGATYTSFVNGQTLPGAWDVELDIPVIDAATSQGFAAARVWGISVQEIAQANDLNGKNIQIFGGMQKGLPLANPAQSGLLISGVVYQCFGNWEGKNMTLDFVISPGAASGSNTGGIGTLKNPKNLTLNWPANQPLAQALQSCLQTGFPGYTINVNISSKIVRPAAETGFYPTLEYLAKYCRETSRDIVKTSGYAGVSIVPTGTTINVFDGTQQQSSSSSSSSTTSASNGSSSSTGTQINYTDLVGQPTWIESPNISFKTVMRADLSVGQQISLPQTIITNTQEANSSLINQKATFQGGFTIVSMRHVGRYRSLAGDSWVSVFEGAPNQVQATAAGGGVGS